MKESSPVSTITKILRRARRDRRETQGEVARRTGISQQLVSRIEKGGAGLEGIVLLARAVGVTAELRVAGTSCVLSHGLDPEERQGIEENIAWFSRLSPAGRLRAIRGHAAAIERLRKAARSSGSRSGGPHGT